MDKKIQKKRSFQTAMIFSALVFIIMAISLFLSMIIAMIGYHLGWFTFGQKNLGFVLLSFALISIIVGTILSKVIGRRPIRVIVGISEATQKIAKGDFTVKLNEDIAAKEIRTMVQNFNLMIRELAHTEMLHNDFIGNVSHEFKTPLSAIEGYVTLLQSKNLSREKQIEYTRKILLATNRLSSLTDNILLLSRLEHQEIEIKKESYSLDEQLRETTLLSQNIWGEKNIELDVDLDSVSYIGNAELLSYVWQNIFGNAVKFTPIGGRIGISLHATDDSVCIKICDNGIGMNNEALQRIYEKFYQGDKSRSGSGNGLGMTLAKRIIDLHDGDILVSSTEGEGTEFTVILPAK